MLTADDPLPHPPRRVAVAGVSGSGKTTLARRIAEALAVRHTEIDALFHGPDWTPRPEFADDVAALVATPSWVTEWQYATAREPIAAHADLMVWLDIPYLLTFTRIVRRTVRRRLLREELWNGNREGPLRHVLTDPGHVVRWSVRTRNKYAELVPAAAAQHPQLIVVRLRNQRDVDRWLRLLAESVA